MRYLKQQHRNLNNAQLKTELQATKNRVKELEVENDDLYENMDALEQYTRKNSLEIEGIPENICDDEEAVLKLAQVLNVNMRREIIDICHRIKRKKSNPIIVRFISHKMKRAFFKQRVKLKNISGSQLFTSAPATARPSSDGSSPKPGIWNRRIQQPHAAFGGHLNLYKRHAGPKKKEKRKQKKKEKEEKQKAMEMRAAALNGIAKRRNSVMESEDESSSSSGEGSDTTIASACPSSSKGKKGPRKKIQHRATKQSAMEMLANKYNQKAELKEKELELRKMELEFQQKKYEAEAEERKAKIHLELEERKAMLALLKDRL
ncbi:hypothetical protein ACROYT_G024533 [Oculina patagonica]